MDQAFCTRSSIPGAALFVLLGVTLSGCGGGDGDSAASSPKPSNTTPANTAPVSAPAPTANKAPTLTGSAVTSVAANANYTFAPAAIDPDGDPLAFQISNKPVWATFDTVTGKLSGLPSLAHAGEYPNIVISVNDGTTSSSLPPFAIKVNGPAASPTVSLAWTAPTLNEDGTVLSDLAGYTIVYGSSRTALDKSIRIANPGIDQYVLDSLPAGTYYFGVKAFTSTGVESTTSNIVTRTIG
jgi:hypothetical protein